MYLRSPPTTYTPYRTTRSRKDPSLEVHRLTPYYVHAVQDHQQKKRSSLKVTTLTTYCVHAIHNHQKKKSLKPQDSFSGTLMGCPILAP